MVHSDTERLNIKFPEEVFMPGCSNRIYSAGCGLNRANFESNSTVEAGSTQIILKCLLGQSEGYFDIGFVEFTTGANSSIKRMVKSYSAGQVILTNPLPVVPQVGDQFKIYPGCDGTMATCKNRFNNLSRFKGYPFAPKPESTL
jgi:uncharacterized phage protein (TIGR02218 family)